MRSKHHDIEYIAGEYRGDLPELDSNKFRKPRKNIIRAAQQRVDLRKGGEFIITDYDEAQDNIDLYDQGDYVGLVDIACHEGATVERLRSVVLGDVYVCSTCSHCASGSTVEDAIQQMAELIMLEIVCDFTGLC